jgi:uncharacterized protein YbjT (DUF2867 family)
VTHRKKMKPLIVVVGATGKQGGSVINALINSGKWTVRGLSRNVSSEASQVKIIKKRNTIFIILTSGINFKRC